MKRLVLLLLFPIRSVAADPLDAQNDLNARELETPMSTAASPLEGAPSFHDFHRVLAHNFTRGLFSIDNVEPLALGSLGTIALLPFDQDISNAFQGNFHQLGDTGHVIGGPVAIAALTTGLLAVAPFTKSQRYRGFTFTLAQGVILSNVLVHSLKLAVPRTRPNEENDQSFPSGHAANAVVLAAVASRYYGKKVGIPIYVLAALVGASRIEKGKHFPSDTVFGATVGYIAASTAIRGSDGFVSQRKWTILPCPSPDSIGLQVLWFF